MKQSSRNKIIQYLFYFFSLALLSSYYATIPIALLVILFFVDSSENIKKKLKKTVKNSITYYFIAYFFIHILGLIYTKNLDKGLKEVILRLPFLLFPFIIFGETISKEMVVKTLLFFKSVVIVVFILLLSYYFIMFDKPLKNFVFFGFTKIAISTFSYSVFIFLAILISLKHSKYKYVELPILFLFLFLIGNRTVIMFLGVYLFYYLFKVKIKQQQRIFIISMISIVLMFVGSTIYNKITVFYKTIDFDIKTIETKNRLTFSRNTIEHRILVWKSALEIIKKHPIIGVGTADYQDALMQEYQKIHFKVAIKNKFNTHNQFFEETLKFGLIGFILFFALFFRLFKTSQNALLFTVILLIFWVSIFESYWSRHHGVTFIAFIIPLLFQYKEKT